jgi:DeoR family suf operon transcriptional repressor
LITPTEEQSAPGKLLLGVSKFAILNDLLEGERTAEQLASILDVNVSAVRGHMIDLENMRLVVSKFRKEGIGRPKKVYSISDPGRELFPRRYDWFLISFLEKLYQTDPKIAMDTVARMSVELATTLRGVIQNDEMHTTQEERLVGLVKSLNNLGFKAKLERKDDNSSRIVRTDCAVFRVAKSNPRLICGAFDTGLLKSVLGKNVKLEETMARGAGQCVHLVVSKEENR